jgi:hypothetical protein
MPSSEDDYTLTNQDTSPQSEAEACHGLDQRIFVKNASGGFVGLTPNQLKGQIMIDVPRKMLLSRQQQSPHGQRRKPPTLPRSQLN